MKLFYDIVQFDNKDRINDEMSPIFGICLYDEERFPYSHDFCDIGKLRGFSLLTQPIGLIWSEKYRCYVIPDDVCFDEYKYNKFISRVEEIIVLINSNDIVVANDLLERESNQSYYTCARTARYLQSFLNLSNCDNPIVLDPCAGVGNLVDGISIDRDKIWLVEPNYECYKTLCEKGYIHVVRTTFEDAVAKKMFPTPTHIIMNPPFSKQRDILFFNTACALLNSGGTIAAIVSENSIYEEIARYKLDYGLTIYDIARNLLNDAGVSENMRIFFRNVLALDQSFFDSVLTGYNEFGFSGACARAYYICGKVRKKINN